MAARVPWMRYIPWSWVRSWRCLECGRCCSQFRITLRAYEYVMVTRRFGQDAVWIDHLGAPCLKTVEGRCAFQTRDGLCRLQSLGMKPLACKVWPFIVHKKTPSCFADEASFHHEGREYFVYVDTLCPCLGINKGHPEEFSLAIAEAVEITHGSEKPQRYTTDSSGPKATARINGYVLAE